MIHILYIKMVEHLKRNMLVLLRGHWCS